MIALLIGYEAVSRLFAPVPIHFREAIPIAALGLCVNVASALLLSGGPGQGHGHDHDHEHDHHHDHDHHDHDDDHARHGHGQDYNMRAAVIHVMADAAVSVLVIVGLTLARLFGWMWMDPLAGVVGALVIASWSWGLIRATGAILLDMNPDEKLSRRMRETIESEGDAVDDLHLWRLGPGHLGAIVAVRPGRPRLAEYYRERLARLGRLSHLTIEIAGRRPNGA
jgi:cation diffusion facilitator family transporter